MISCYFDTFSEFELYPDVIDTLDRLSRRFKLAIVSNIDDDLLAMTPLSGPSISSALPSGPEATSRMGRCSAICWRMRGLLPTRSCTQANRNSRTWWAAKPLGLPVAWINRRGIALSPKVPRPDFQFPDIQSLVALVMPAR